MTKYGMLLGLSTQHYNMEIAMEWRIKLGIMVEFADHIGLKVYGIAKRICQHIQYEEDDVSIKEKLNKLLSVGNAKITARKLKLNSSRNKGKNDPTNNSSRRKEER